MQTQAQDAAALEAARKLFAQDCQFLWGAAEEGALPPEGLPEIAFAGRSNVGKSSLINALTGRKTLARTSHTPGRTQQLNFFDLGGRLHLVDLPGYGYAKVSKTQRAAWTKLLRRYLAGRVTLARACVLVDARHGLKDSDAEIMGMLDQAAVPYLTVLTKADQLSAATLADRIAAIEAALKKHPAAAPSPHPTSSRDGTGLPELRATLAAHAAPESGQ